MCLEGLLSRCHPISNFFYQVISDTGAKFMTKDRKSTREEKIKESFILEKKIAAKKAKRESRPFLGIKKIR